MHLDEIKFKDEINGYEQQLFQSKIKELESKLSSMHNKMRVFNFNDSALDISSQAVGNEENRPQSSRMNHSFRLESIQLS